MPAPAAPGARANEAVLNCPGPRALSSMPSFDDAPEAPAAEKTGSRPAAATSSPNVTPSPELVYGT